MNSLDLPMEPVRDWYVTFFGGRSAELEPGLIGINRRNLERTRLTPYVDRVYIRKLEGGKAVPLYIRETYEIVPLDENRPDALSKSPMGEAVLPEEPDIFRRPLAQWPRIKEPVLLNNVLSRLIGSSKDWSQILTASYILKRGGLK
jgi:hypothetical protein